MRSEFSVIRTMRCVLFRKENWTDTTKISVDLCGQTPKASELNNTRKTRYKADTVVDIEVRARYVP